MIKSIGIDIGRSSIKVAEVVQTKKGLFIESFKEYPLSISPTADHELEKIEALKKIRDSYLNQNIVLNFAVSQSKVSYRDKSFPFSDRIKINKALPFELEEDLPFSIDNSFWDFRIHTQIGTESQVLVACVTQHQIEKLMEFLNPLGLPIKKITSEGSAFHTSLSSYNEGINKKTLSLENQELSVKNLRLVLNIGHHQTVVNLYDGKTWINSSVILWGGENLIKKISQRYDIDIIESKRVLEEKAFLLIQQEDASYEQIVFSETLGQEFKTLTKELKLIVLGFESHYQSPITSIGITGGVSQVINLGPFLTQQLELPVNPIFYLDNWQQSPYLNKEIAYKMSIALGLAIEGIKKGVQPGFQFLQGSYKNQDKKFEHLWNILKPSIYWGASLLLCFWVWSSLRLSFSTNLLDSAQERVKEAGVTIANLPKKQSNERQIKSYIKNSKSIIADRKIFQEASALPSAFHILNEISSSFPNRNLGTLEVNEISISDGKISLKGKASGGEVKKKLESSLKSMSKNSQIIDKTPQNNDIIHFEFLHHSY